MLLHPLSGWVVGVVIFLPGVLCSKHHSSSTHSPEEEGEVSTAHIPWLGAWCWWPPRCSALLPSKCTAGVGPVILLQTGEPPPATFPVQDAFALLPGLAKVVCPHTHPTLIHTCTNHTACHLRMGTIYFEKPKGQDREPPTPPPLSDIAGIGRRGGKHGWGVGRAADWRSPCPITQVHNFGMFLKVLTAVIATFSHLHQINSNG